MTPQELKNSILQLAVQGKLVEQRAEEGTGEELYQQIQKEKAKLIREGKISKGKKIYPLTEDDALEVPDKWICVRLGNVLADILVPQRDKPKVFCGDIPWCRIEDIEGKYLNGTKSNQYVSRSTINEMNLKVNPVGTVISANSASVGAAAITTVECITNQTFIGLVCMEGLYNEYLYYYLLAKKNEIRKMGAGTTILYVSQDKYWNFVLPLPSFDEQKRIVAKIEELLPLIDRYGAAWEKLEAFNKKFPGDMQKSILQMAIQGKLVEQRAEEGTGEELYQQIQKEKAKLIREGKIKKEKPLPEITDDEKPFDIPESWKWVRWGSLSESIQYGYNAPAKEKGRIKMVRISDIQDNNVLWETVPYCDISENDIETYILEENDILFARTGGTVGKSFLVKYVPEEAIYAGYLIRTRYSENLCPEYMKYFMESQLYWEQLHNGTIATAQPNCNGNTLSKMIIPLPPLAEQKRIVSKIEELLPLCERLK